MATLHFEDLSCPAPALRDWLGGEWGMLFSHPQDFEDHGFERDRWLDILRGRFREQAVRPIALRGERGQGDASWVSSLFADHRLVRLQRGSASSIVDYWLDQPARQLRDFMQGQMERFVVWVDGQLHIRGSVGYAAGAARRSPLDLLGCLLSSRHQARQHSSAEFGIVRVLPGRARTGERQVA